MNDRTRYSVVLLALAVLGHAAAQEVASPSSASATTQPAAAMPVPQAGYVDLLAGLAYTDNALLANGHRTSDGIGTVGFSTDYVRRGNLSLNLLGTVERMQYLHQTFPGSFYGDFLGSAILGKSTDPLQWHVQEAFGETMPDPLAAPTPQNLETINDVSTGPVVNLHFGLTNRLTLSGDYSRTTYQRSPFDSQTYDGGLEFSHALSGASTLSLEASNARTQYLERAALQSFLGVSISAYTIRQAFISYDARFVRTRIVLRAGYNMLSYQPGASHGAPLYEVDISRRISPFSTVFISGRSEYSTNGSTMATTQAQIALQSGASLNPAYSVAEPYNQRTGVLGWAFHRARTRFSLTGTISQALFNQATPAISVRSLGEDNYVTEGGDLMIARQLRPTVSIQLRGTASVYRYSNLDARTQRETVELTFSKQFRRLAVWVYAERIHQGGSQGISTFQPASYNDDVVGLSVTYDLFGQRAPGSFIGGTPSLTGLMGGY